MLLTFYYSKKSKDGLIVSSAKTEAGFWLDSEPVQRVMVDDPCSLSGALRNVIAYSGRVIPTPPANSKPVVLAYSKAKTWGAFEREYDQVSVDKTSDGAYVIERYKPSPEGRGFVVDVGARKVLPAEASVDDLAAELGVINTSNPTR